MNSSSSSILRSVVVGVVVLLAGVLFLATPGVVFADTCTTTTSGIWNTTNASLWSCNRIPGVADNVVISNDVTLESDPSVNSLTINDSKILDGNGYELTISGIWTNNGTFIPGLGEVIFIGTNSSINGSASTFNFLTIGSGSSTINAPVVVNTSLTINQNATLITENYAITGVSGSTINLNTSTTFKIGGTLGFPSGFTNKIFKVGSVVEYNGSTQTIAALGYGSLRVSNNGTKMLSGTTSVARELNIANNSVLNLKGCTITGTSGWGFILGSYSKIITEGGPFPSGFSPTASNIGDRSIIEYNGSGDETISNIPMTWNGYGYEDLTISGTGIKSLDGNIKVNHTLVTGIGSTLALNNNTLTVYGDFTHNGSFNAGTGTVIFAATPNQTLTANANIAFHDVIVTSETILTEAESGIGAVTYTGDLINPGVIQKTQSWSGNGSKTFGLAGYLPAGELEVVANYWPFSLTVQRTDINANHYTTIPMPIGAGRHWHFSATGSGYTVNVTLPFESSILSDNAHACHYTSVWYCGHQGATSNTVTLNSISATVLAASEWAIGNSYDPTAVNINYFRSTKSTGGVVLSWETVSEASTAGFNIYRREKGDDDFEKINTNLILPQVAGTPEGSAYTYLDDSAMPGIAYEYQLEVIETSLQSSTVVLLTHWPYSVSLPLVQH